MFSSTKNKPTLSDLENSKRQYKGRALYAQKAIFNEFPLYDPDHYKSVYNQHIRDTEDYFSGRDNFLKINLRETNSLERLCNFLGFKNSIWILATSFTKIQIIFKFKKI